MNLLILLLSESGQTKLFHKACLHSDKTLENANESIVTKRSLRKMRGSGSGLQQGILKLLEVMEMFIIFILIMAS